MRWGDGKAAPVRRARHVGEVLRGKAGKARHHHFFAADWLALPRMPRHPPGFLYGRLSK